MIIEDGKFYFIKEVADNLMKELKSKTNRFVNRGIEDYLKYRKNDI